MHNIRATLTSREGWKLAKEPSSLAPPGVTSNKDLDPIPPELRVWTALDFANYWVSDLVNITSWSIGTAPLLVGLSTVDAIVIVMLSGFCNAVPTLLNGFGYYFGYFAVVSRAVLSAVWFGVNCYYGLFGMTEAIAAIWPSYRDIPNHLPESAGITTRQMISFFLFTTMHIPFMLIPVHRLKRLFFCKTIVIIPVSIAMTIWICVKAGDVKGIFNQPATVTGSTHTWHWLATFCSTTNSWLTATVNMADYSRFSKGTRGQWAQLPTIPIVNTVYAILGLAVVGAGRVLYDEDLSNPVTMLPYWNSTAGGRFLSFCCAMLWMLAQISCDLSANAVPFGHDIMAILPGWINVRRGAILCLLLGAWAMVPWLIVNSASKFLTFMSAYGVFLSSICSIMIADYFVVRRRRLNVVDLYHPHGCYRYKAGINWRAFVTEFIFVGITLPGVVNSTTPTIPIPGGFLRLYQLNWFVNTIGAFVV
ncbi:permease for cytosine/purines, uracil, thiamine, allantoin-domain-containing protein [Aspergillus karnatakaensis]|uniref:permease for cytosine/purines, uracil, thiamine, allantoin-domain-containing protein n=1 Tax=Aspergillus karnatakaensis TaxID=1810916 RepID=UPI003CCE13FE